MLYLCMRVCWECCIDVPVCDKTLTRVSVSRCLCNYVCLRMTLYTCNTAFLSTSDFVSMADADGGWLVEFENFIGMTGMDLEHAA